MRKPALALSLTVLVVLAFIPSYMKPVAKAETTLFSDGFESGTFLTTDSPAGAWTRMAIGEGCTASISTSNPIRGLYDAEFIAAPGGSIGLPSMSAGGWWCCVKASFTATATAFMRAYYTFSTLPQTGEYVVLNQLRANTNYAVAVLLANVSGSMFWGMDTIEAGSDYHIVYEAVASNATTGVPYCIEIKRDVANGLEQLWVDGVSKVTDNVGITNNCAEILAGYDEYVGGTQQTCYVDCVVVADAYIGPLADITPPTFGTISTNTTIAGQSCSFNCLVSDDTNVSIYIFSTNNTGSWINDTAVAFSNFYNSTAAWANVTKTLNDTVGNVVSYLWYANDTSNNWSASDQFNLTVTTPYRPNLQMTPDSITCRKYLETFTVQINLTNAIDTQAFSFTIYYDPLLLNYSSIGWGQLGIGTITKIDTANGILEGNVAGSPINGNHWLLNITFQAAQTIIWKEGLTNELEGKIWLHKAQLNFTGNSTLQYVEGGINQIDVNQAAYTFLPIRGDVNSDGTVDIFDLRAIAAYYDKTQTDPSWSTIQKYDLNNDGSIDIYDLVVVASNYGFTYP